MGSKKLKHSYLISFLILGIFFLFSRFIYTSKGTSALYLNNVNNDFTIDGFVNVWFNISIDQQDISVRFDSSILRIVTGVRTTYRTANLIAPMNNCPATYKFESGSYWVDYNDMFPNTTGNNETHVFYCQGDTFLMTSSFFYISIGCGSDDPFIQVGYDKDRSGHSEYSLNGGPWTPDTVEYLVEAIIEDIVTLTENTNISGLITTTNDFVDAYNISLNAEDTVHFYLDSDNSNEYFNMRLFPGNIKLSNDINATWLEEGSIAHKHKQYNAASGDYILLIEPNTDGVDNGSYYFKWTYSPSPPLVTGLPIIDSDGNINLSWTPPSDTDIAYYNIYRSNSSNVPKDLQHMISTPGAVTGSTFQEFGLPNGTHFYIVTTVDNNSHESEKSNEVNTTVIDTTNPSPPLLNLPLDYPIDSDGKVILTWNRSIDEDVVSYNIYRANVSSVPIDLAHMISVLGTVINLNYTDFPLKNGTYYYRVTAVDDNVLESVGSNEVNTTVIDTTIPKSPYNLTAQCRGSDVFLSWNLTDGIDVKSFKIYRSNTPIYNISGLTPIYNTTMNNWTDINVPSGNYYYVVTSIDINGLESNISNLIEIVIPQTPKFFWVPNETSNWGLVFLLFGVIITSVFLGTAGIFRVKKGVWPWKEKNIKDNFKKLVHISKEKIIATSKYIKTNTIKISQSFFTKIKSLVKTTDGKKHYLKEPTELEKKVDEALLNSINSMKKEELMENISNFLEDLREFAIKDPSYITSAANWLQIIKNYPLSSLTLKDSQKLAGEILIWEEFIKSPS